MFVFDISCTGGFEVPFGRSVLCFFVRVWVSEKDFFVASCTGGFEVPFGRSVPRLFVKVCVSLVRVVFG